MNYPNVGTAGDSSAQDEQSTDQTHYKEDWEDKREVITTLYAQMSLEKLMDEMRQRYGFNAKRYMYLRRIKDWGIQKNVKATEKEAAIKQRRNPNTTDRSDVAASIPAHKIQRHLRRQRRMDSLCRTWSQEHATGKWVASQGVPRDNATGRFAVDARLQQRYHSDAFMSGKFLFSPLERSSEIFLAALQEFMEVRLAAFEHEWSVLLNDGRQPCTALQKKSQHQMFQYLQAARMAHSFNNLKEFLHNMDKVCELTQGVMRNLRWTLIPDLLCGFNGIWLRSARYGAMFWRFFTDMAKAIFPDSHSRCLVQILSLFPDVRCQPIIFGAASQIMLRSADKALSSGLLLGSIAQQYALQFHLAWGLFGSAQELAQRSFPQCLDSFGVESSEMQFVALQLADAQFCGGKPEAAKATTEKALQLYLDNNSEPNILCVKMAIQMSYICCKLQLANDTQHYCSLGKVWVEQLDLLESNAFEYTYFCEMLRLIHDLKQGTLESICAESSPPESLKWSTCKPVDDDFKRLTRVKFNSKIAGPQFIVVSRTVSGHQFYASLPVRRPLPQPSPSITETTLSPQYPHENSDDSQDEEMCQRRIDRSPSRGSALTASTNA